MKKNYEDMVLSFPEVLELLDIALADGKPLSLARFGHSELAYALWKTRTELVNEFHYSRAYGGATGSFDSIKKDLISALHSTDIAGLLTLEESDESCSNLTNEFLKEAGGEYNYVCSAFITHQMYRNPIFWDWLKKVRVSLVGRRAQEAKYGFMDRGVTIANTINLEGYDQIEMVEEHLASKKDWDVALISAGIPATILAPRLAKRTNRIAIDFGHAMDQVVDGEDFDYEELVRVWNNSNKK